MEDWHLYAGASLVAIGLAIKPVLMAWSRALVRQAETFYAESDLPTHEDKQSAAKDALAQTWAGKMAPKSMTDTIKPGESERPPKGE